MLGNAWAQVPSGATRPSAGYLPGLDGLRAISVVAVLLYHADMPWMPGGFLGVEVFFVISGYLITLLLTEEFTPHHDDLAGQLLAAPGPPAARRPVHAAGRRLGGRAALLPRGGRRAGRRRSGRRSPTSRTGTSSSPTSRTSPLVERPPVFQHLWSLAIEEQFYLVWPLLLLGLLRAVGRHRARSAASSSLGGGRLVCVWMAVLFEPAMDPSRVYYGTDTRASGLLLGAALALVWQADARLASRRRGARRVALDLAGMAAIGVLVVCFAADAGVPTRSSTAAASPSSRMASCVAIMAAVHPGTRARSARARPARC